MAETAMISFSSFGPGRLFQYFWLGLGIVNGLFSRCYSLSEAYHGILGLYDPWAECCIVASLFIQVLMAIHNPRFYDNAESGGPCGEELPVQGR